MTRNLGPSKTVLWCKSEVLYLVLSSIKHMPFWKQKQHEQHKTSNQTSQPKLHFSTLDVKSKCDVCSAGPVSQGLMWRCLTMHHPNVMLVNMF